MIRRRYFQSGYGIAVLLTAVCLALMPLHLHGQELFSPTAFFPDQAGAPELTVTFGPNQCGSFVPLGSYEAIITISGTANLGALGLELTIPDGWIVEDITGPCAPDVSQIEATDNLLEFAWTTFDFGFLPCRTSVFLRVPTGTGNEALFSARALYLLNDDETDFMETQNTFFVAINGNPCVGGISCAGAGGSLEGDSAVAAVGLALLLICGVACRSRHNALLS